MTRAPADVMPRLARCPNCGRADQVTYGQNGRGTWIGCIRCQNARDGYPNVPAAIWAWARGESS